MNLRLDGRRGGWAALILLLLSLTGCDTVVTEVEGIRIQGFPDAPMAVGESVQAAAEPIGRGWPEGARVEWFSEDSRVAVVSATGRIQAVSPGETRIAVAYAGRAETRSLVVVAALEVESRSLPEGEVGESYGYALEASGGQPPYRWSLVQGSLPVGLSLPTDGTFVGTPAQVGNWAFTVRVVDAAGRSAEAAVAIQVEEAPAILTTELPAAEVGQSYRVELQAERGRTPYTWSVATGRLPSGLSLSTQGVISGTPTTLGTERITLRVTGSNGLSSAREFDLEVSEAPSITTDSLPAGQVGESYTVTLRAAGGVTPYTWSRVTGALPEGLSLSPAGVISGTPEAAGTFSFITSVTGANGLSSTREFELAVAQAPVANVAVGPDGGSVAVGFTLQMTATLRDARGQELTDRAVTWRSSNTAVARVDDTGLVRGVSTGTVVISATSEGVTGSADLVVIIAQAPSILETNMQWVTGVAQCEPDFRDGRTSHDVRFRLPLGVGSVDGIQVEVEYRATTAEAVGPWQLRSIATDWRLTRDNGIWTAVRPENICWGIGSTVIWIEERLRIRLTPSAPWSDWSFSRLFLSDRPAQALGRLESEAPMLPVYELRMAPSTGAAPHP